MAEIVNLRRARKRKARSQKSAEADAKRLRHGQSTVERDRVDAETEKLRRSVDAAKLE